MLRWSNAKSDNIENSKIDAFLKDIFEVYKKHGFAISHEDRHGGFLIKTINDQDINWLNNADDYTEAD